MSVTRSSNLELYILLFWFSDDWGQFGRAYERVAENLAKLPEVAQVVCMFPPVSARKAGPGSTMYARPISPNLALLSETDHCLFNPRGPGFRLRRWVNRKYRDFSLRRYLKSRGFTEANTILWLFPPHPYIDRLLTAVPHSGVVAHVIDNFTKFDPGHELHQRAIKQYPELGNWADLIITTSEANRELFSQHGKPCYMFWPAVDQSFIGAPDVLPYKLNGARPQLGYVGWIMDRTDLDLVAHVLRSRPDWQVTLVGPEYPEGLIAKSGLLDFPNFSYRGPMPQADVPDFLRSLDVCIMPHRDNEYSRSMGPLKLYQYLASGRPVVTTEVGGLDRVRDYIRVAADYDDFVHQIEFALTLDDTKQSTARINFARNESWETRAREMLHTALQHIKLQ